MPEEYLVMDDTCRPYEKGECPFPMTQKEDLEFLKKAHESGLLLMSEKDAKKVDFLLYNYYRPDILAWAASEEMEHYGRVSSQCPTCNGVLCLCEKKKEDGNIVKAAKCYCGYVDTEIPDIEL